MRPNHAITHGSSALKVEPEVTEEPVETSAINQTAEIKKELPVTFKPYFADIIAGEPSQVVKDYELIDAATDGDTARVRELLTSGADPKADDNSPLQLAAANGHTDTVKILLQHGADRRNSEALIEAAGAGYADVVGELVKDGVEASVLKKALQLASEGHVQIPSVFSAREHTPEGGHKKTLEILQRLERRGPTVAPA